MSLFQPKVIRLSIEPQRAVLVKLGGGRSREIIADSVVPLATDAGTPDAMLAPLHAALSEPGWRGRHTQIVLSDRLARYFVFAMPQGVRGRKELELLIEARFEEVFGLPAEAWRLVADLAPYTAHILVCAVERTWLNALQKLCAEHTLPIDSIQPFLVSEFNSWRRRIDDKPLWFATVEPGSVTLGFLAKKTWQSVRMFPLRGSLDAELPALIERDRLNLDMALPTSHLLCAGTHSAETRLPQAPSPVQAQWLDRADWPGKPGAWSQAHRLALSGVWQ